MAKKNSHISDDKLSKITEQVAGEPVDTNVNPDGLTIEPSIGDSEKVTVVDETPVTPDSEKIVDENPTPDVTKTPVVDENPTPNITEKSIDDQTPDTTKTPVVDENLTPDVTKNPVMDEKPVDTDLTTKGSGETVVNKKTNDETLSDEKPVIINEFKRFNIRFGYSIDSRSSTTRRTLSTTEIVKQFVKAPTCFIAFETKEDIKYFETLLKIKTIKVEDKEGKLVNFSDAAKNHLIERVTELSKYWIARNSK